MTTRVLHSVALGRNSRLLFKCVFVVSGPCLDRKYTDTPPRNSQSNLSSSDLPPAWTFLLFLSLRTSPPKYEPGDSLMIPLLCR